MGKRVAVLPVASQEDLSLRNKVSGEYARDLEFEHASFNLMVD